MTTNEFICVCLGLGMTGRKVDEICDNFGIDLNDGDVYETLDLFRGNYTGFGNYFISHLYQRVIEEWSAQGLDEEKFDYEANGDASELLYDGNLVSCNEDLQNILDKLEEEEEG